MSKTVSEENSMKRKDFLALQRCSCGAYLEYKEEQFTKMCWCCAAQVGKDIGAIYYYSTGIWQKPNYRGKRKPRYEKGRQP